MLAPLSQQDDGESTHVYETSSIELVSDHEVQQEAHGSLEEYGSGDDVGDQARVLPSRQMFTQYRTTSAPDFAGTVLSNNANDADYITRSTAGSTEERLARISRELDEISNADPANPKTNTLQQRLDNLVSGNDEPTSTYSDKLYQLIAAAQPNSATASRGIPTSSDSNGFATARQALELEERIRRIESSIGQSDTSVEFQISAQIQDLFRKISVCFHPEYNLDKIKCSVEEMKEEITKLESRRRVMEITSLAYVREDEFPPEASIDAVNATYKLALEATEINKQVPSIVARLLLLSTLHAELADGIDVTSHLGANLEKMAQDIDRWNSSISLLQKQIRAFSEGSMNNRKASEQQIDDIGSRLASLGT